MTKKNNYKGGVSKMDEFKENEMYPNIYNKEEENNYKGGVSKMDEFKENEMYPDVYNNYDEAVKDLNDVLVKMNETVIDDINTLVEYEDYETIERIMCMYKKVLNYKFDLTDKLIEEKLRSVIVEYYKELGYMLQKIENAVNEMERV